MIPVFPIHPAPAVRGVEVTPVSPEGCVGIRGGKVFTFTKEVEINGQPLPVEGICMTVFDGIATVSIPQGDFISVIIGKVDQPWDHAGE